MYCVNDKQQLIQWDLKKNSLVKTAKTLSSINYCLSLDHPEYLAVGDFDGRLSLYSQQSLELLYSFESQKDYENRINCVLMDQEVLPNLVVTGSQDGIIRVHSVDPSSKQIKVRREFYGGTEAITSLALNADKTLMVSTSKEAYSKVWNIKDFSF